LKRALGTPVTARYHHGPAVLPKNQASLFTNPKETDMAAKTILMLCGDYCEDYETMVPFQTL